LQALVSEAITQGQDTVDRAALAELTHAWRSVDLIAISRTRDCPGRARPQASRVRRLLGRQDDYPRFTQDWAVPRQQRNRAGYAHG
jgi:hypothetical protein